MGEAGSPKPFLCLMASSGFLDDTWHDRTLCTHGRTWPGRRVFAAAHVAPKSGQVTVFDESTTYAIKAFMPKSFMSPRHIPGQGYGHREHASLAAKSAASSRTFS